MIQQKKCQLLNFPSTSSTSSPSDLRGPFWSEGDVIYIYIFVYLQYTVLYTDMLYSPFLKRTQTQHKTKPWQSPGEHHHIVVLEHRRMSNGICVWYLCLCVAWPHWGETSAQRKEACYHVEACKTHGCVKQFETHQSCVKWSWNGRNSLGYM